MLKIPDVIDLFTQEKLVCKPENPSNRNANTVHETSVLSLEQSKRKYLPKHSFTTLKTCRNCGLWFLNETSKL